MRWGKYKTIMIGVVITIIAHVVSVYGEKGPKSWKALD